MTGRYQFAQDLGYGRSPRQEPSASVKYCISNSSGLPYNPLVAAANGNEALPARVGGCKTTRHHLLNWSLLIAKNQNTYAKRQREQEKKQRADDKRAKRDRKKNGPDASTPMYFRQTPAAVEPDSEENP
jgi:predicted Fe-S protein YdhL (DUF1289 family)